MTKDEIKKEWQEYAGWLKQFDDAPATAQRNLISATLDLIAEQEQEIERLKAENDYLQKHIETLHTQVREVDKIIKQAEIEMLELLKDLAQSYWCDGKCVVKDYVTADDIDKLIEEVKAE